MSVITYEGVIENGQIRLPEHIHLPEQARVFVVIADTTTMQRVRVSSPRLVHPEQAADFEMEVREESTDAPL